MKSKRQEIKICGVSDAGDAALAERLGADYIGLVFAKESPRSVSSEAADKIACSLVGKARVVGVFTGAAVGEIAAVARRVGFGIVQLHRRAAKEDVERLRGMGFEVWTLAGGAEGDGVLFDSSHGDGERRYRKGGYKGILAGGISAANLAAALAQGPDVVDVSSSIESAPGRKDPAKLADLMNTFHSLTKENKPC